MALGDDVRAPMSTYVLQIRAAYARPATHVLVRGVGKQNDHAVNTRGIGRALIKQSIDTDRMRMGQTWTYKFRPPRSRATTDGAAHR